MSGGTPRYALLGTHPVHQQIRVVYEAPKDHGKGFYNFGVEEIPPITYASLGIARGVLVISLGMSGGLVKSHFTGLLVIFADY